MVLKLGFTPVPMVLRLCLPCGAARRPRSLAGRASSPSRGQGCCSGRTKMAAGQAAPSRAKGRCAPAVNCCFRTGTDQGNPTVESKHSIAIATQGFDAM